MHDEKRVDPCIAQIETGQFILWPFLVQGASLIIMGPVGKSSGV